MVQLPGLRLWDFVKHVHEIKLKGVDVFSVIREKGEVNFFIGKLLKALYFLSTFVVKTEKPSTGILSNFVLPVIEN